MTDLRNHELSYKVLIGMFLGVAVGIVLRNFFVSDFLHEYIIDGFFDLGGKVFISSLKMLVVPLVFFSLVCGVSNLDNVKSIGSLGIKTFFLYLLTTGVAISLALFFAILIQPGSGFNLPAAIDFQAQPASSFKDVLLNIFPTNPIKSAAEGNMLQVIVFALLFGMGLAMGKKKTATLLKVCEQLNNVHMNIVTFLMQLAPYGVFFLVAKVFADLGYQAITPLLSYFFLVLFVLFFHLIMTYGLMLKYLSKINLHNFFTYFRSVMMFAFSTASSSATLPITMKTVMEKFKVRKSIAAFTLPLGATINMDGTAIMQGVATVFIAQAYQIDISWLGYLTVVLTATLASIGAAGVPGVGLITLAMVLRQVGLPVEGIGLIIGVDRLLDMVRSMVNVCGDATVSCIIENWEQKQEQHASPLQSPSME